MATRTLHPLVDRVLQMVGRQRGPGVRDSQLLERFINLKDETAFETILWRHGPMVLGLCRNLLRDPLPQMARELRVRSSSIGELREMIRPVADALGNMVRGSLSGLFDGPTTVRLDFAGQREASLAILRLHDLGVYQRCTLDGSGGAVIAGTKRRQQGEREYGAHGPRNNSRRGRVVDGTVHGGFPVLIKLNRIVWLEDCQGPKIDRCG